MNIDNVREATDPACQRQQERATWIVIEDKTHRELDADTEYVCYHALWGLIEMALAGATNHVTAEAQMDLAAEAYECYLRNAARETL